MSVPDNQTEVYARHLYQALRAELHAHPYRTMVIAAGVGYLLATRLGGSLVTLLAGRVGMRIASTALAPALDDLMKRHAL